MESSITVIASNLIFAFYLQLSPSRTEENAEETMS